mmetsp:Transcript_224/g.599  ORF Transcript_224/g.599 Transcript_224/m.599 type:complete len:99 (+) Transcript_224:412-708(+)
MPDIQQPAEFDGCWGFDDTRWDSSLCYLLTSYICETDPEPAACPAISSCVVADDDMAADDMPGEEMPNLAHGMQAGSFATVVLPVMLFVRMACLGMCL